MIINNPLKTSIKQIIKGDKEGSGGWRLCLIPQNLLPLLQ
jgi:hypothetical protein